MKPIIIAGPCMAESMELVEEVADQLSAGLKDVEMDFYFKASYDKANRRKAEAGRGPGLSKGLEYLQSVKNKYDLQLLTDVHDPWHCNDVADVVDVLQIPAGLCRQTDLLVAAGVSAHEMNKKINIKKGTSLAPEDMQYAAQKVGELSTDSVWLCERGTSFGHGDLVVDMRGLNIMSQSNHPVIFDCTHSTNKQSKYAAELARAAAATGSVSGIFMEVHPDPKNALCDGPCMLTPDQAIALIKETVEIMRRFNEFL